MIHVASNRSGLIVLFKVQDTTKSAGEGKTGLTAATIGTIKIKRSDADAAVAPGAIHDATVLGTYESMVNTHAAIKEVDSTSMKGVYELHVPNSLGIAYGGTFASGDFVAISISGGTNAAPVDILIQIDPAAKVTAIDSAVAAPSGFLNNTSAPSDFLDSIIPAAASPADKAGWNLRECLWAASRFPMFNKVTDDQANKRLYLANDSDDDWAWCTYSGSIGGTIIKPAMGEV